MSNEDEDDDDFDPVLANSFNAIGLEVLFQSNSIKQYFNKWTVIAVDANNSENLLAFQVDSKDSESISNQISEQTDWEDFGWMTYPTDYYVASVSMSFENLYISHYHAVISETDAYYDDEKETIRLKPGVQASEQGKPGFFGKGGWTSVVTID